MALSCLASVGNVGTLEHHTDVRCLRARDSGPSRRAASKLGAARIEAATSGGRTVVVARDRRLVSQLLRRHLDELLVLSEREWERLSAPITY